VKGADLKSRERGEEFVKLKKETGKTEKGAVKRRQSSRDAVAQKKELRSIREKNGSRICPGLAREINDNRDFGTLCCVAGAREGNGVEMLG